MAGRPKIHPIEVSQYENKAAYMREWRRLNPTAAEYNRQAARCHGRALTALARAHQDEFDHLLNVERALAGLPPVGPQGRQQYVSDIDGSV